MCKRWVHLHLLSQETGQRPRDRGSTSLSPRRTLIQAELSLYQRPSSQRAQRSTHPLGSSPGTQVPARRDTTQSLSQPSMIVLLLRLALEIWAFKWTRQLLAVRVEAAQEEARTGGVSYAAHSPQSLPARGYS